MHRSARLRLRLFAVALLAAFTAHVLLTGRTWVWNLLSPIPPIFFVLVPLLLLAYSAWKRDTLVVACSIALLALGWTQADINLGTLTHTPATITGSTLSTFTWNTRFWNEENDADFYAFLRAHDADIVQLQEYWDRNGNGLALTGELHQEFPEHQAFTSGELVTLVRRPIVATVGSEHASFLRVDMQREAGTVSFYNVHIPMQLGWNMPRIFARRAEAFAALEADIAANPHPVFVAGDFNSTTAMGVMRPLLGRLDDAAAAGGALFPTTWAFHFAPWLRLWRIDFALLDPRLSAHAFSLVDPGARSDHWGQTVLVQ